MVRRVEWTEAALADLEAVTDYIAVDSQSYARAFVTEVRDAARSLETLAQRGRVVPESDVEEVRELFIRRYRLIYLVTRQSVQILAFVHGARDLETMWSDHLAKADSDE